MNTADSKALRILLADDHGIIRLGTAAFLKLQLSCEICAEAANGRQALKLAESTRPDVAVIDLGLPELNGLEVTAQMRRISPQTEVVVLSGDASAEMGGRAFEAGARAFINKAEATTHLAQAVRMAAAHRFYLTPEAHASLRGQEQTGAVRRKKATGIKLTGREREVIQLVAEGKSNKQVAALLGLSVKTVETHRASLIRKLKFRGLSDLVRYAIEHKIIPA